MDTYFPTDCRGGNFRNDMKTHQKTTQNQHEMDTRICVRVIFVSRVFNTMIDTKLKLYRVDCGQSCQLCLIEKNIISTCFRTCLLG